jgi:small subunit ribosomal protein S21
MPEIRIHKGEPIEKAIRRFKKMVSKEGIIQIVRDHCFYEKPSDRKRKNKKKTPRY